MSHWSYSERLITHLSSCDECHGDLVLSDNEPAEVTIYTRNGTKFSQHLQKFVQIDGAEKNSTTVIQ